jgi:hypothetical protein
MCSGKIVDICFEGIIFESRPHYWLFRLRLFEMFQSLPLWKPRNYYTINLAVETVLVNRIVRISQAIWIVHLLVEDKVFSLLHSLI